MTSKKFNEPQLKINRVYTRTGDEGQTNLAGGQRVFKDALRVEAYGAVDELIAAIGLARESVIALAAVYGELKLLDGLLQRVQQELFNLGSMLATKEEDFQPRQPCLTDTDVEQLEKEIDAMNAGLPALSSFVLPGGSRLNAELHLCRTICRRAERHCVRLRREENSPVLCLHYLNRLADALFVWSRWCNCILGAAEILWDPNQSTSAKE
jgi:cob(I)alamin adenosyltransferase